MDKVEKSSTPEYGHRNIVLNLNLSEISESTSVHDSAFRVNKNLKERRELQKQGKSIHDSFSDSEYETVDVREIKFYEDVCDCDKTTDTIDRENSNSVNLSPLSVKLFRSPSEANYDNYLTPYLDSLENETSSISLVSSPEFQLKFRYSAELTTYARPLGRKRRPSEISFSPKWVNRVSSKYGSPSQIPPVDATPVISSLFTEGKRAADEKLRRKYTRVLRARNSDTPDERSNVVSLPKRKKK